MAKNSKIRPKSVLSDPDRRRKVAADFTNRSISQWMLMEGLAYAERWGVACMALIFLFDRQRDFLSVAGVVFLLLQLAVMAPVYGILVYLTLRGAYVARKMIGKRINSMEELKKTGRAVFIFWGGIVYLFTYACFDMYYDLVAMLTKPLLGK